MLELYASAFLDADEEEPAGEAGRPFVEFKKSWELDRLKDELELITGREDLKQEVEGGRKSRLHLRAARDIRFQYELKGESCSGNSFHSTLS